MPPKVNSTRKPSRNIGSSAAICRNSRPIRMPTEAATIRAMAMRMPEPALFRAAKKIR
ncbi:hypothetical protein D3C87_2172660 [compost metagenome]